LPPPGGVPIRIHVLTPLGALVFTGFRFAPGAWVGFLLLVLLHEMGHALLVMRYRLRVSSIDLHAYGGLCRWSGQATDWERAVIAWGGVVAQAALWAVTVGVVAVFGYPRDMFARELVEVFTRTNLWLMLINLAPFPPLDGVEAWRGVGELRRRWASRAPPAGDPPRSETSESIPDTKLSPEEARRIATWGKHVSVKIPITNTRQESAIPLIGKLSQEGIGVNATAILSFNQAILAAKAGATYVSIFAGRVADEGNDPAIVIQNVRRWLDDWGLSAHIIVGSIRTVMDIQNAALAGTHIITVPPQFLPKMVDHRYSRETVRQFVQDAEKTITQMAKSRAAAGV